jgi:hypothetical protein
MVASFRRRPNMPNLSDIQSLLLSHASRQANGSLCPLPDTLGDARRTTRPIAALVRAGFVEEREAGQPGEAARTDGDLSFGLYLTSAGAAAIGIEPEGASSGAAPATPGSSSAAAFSARGTSKIAHVIELLSRGDGASVAELIEATGWLPHTTRAALTGLRKKGHQIEKARVGEVTRYHITAVTA